jgi:hypothetical protein
VMVAHSEPERLLPLARKRRFLDVTPTARQLPS